MRTKIKKKIAATALELGTSSVH